MAKFTAKIVVTDEWVTLADGLDTVLVSLGGGDSVMLAVADALGDLHNTNDSGHLLRATGLPSASFGGLGTKGVFARVPTGADATFVHVTAY